MTPTRRTALAYIAALVHRRAAIVLGADKDYLIESRLAPLARDEGFSTIDELATALARAETGSLSRRVVDAMTTNETSFFRDDHPFETLRTEVFPALIRARAVTRTLRIWCGAASTGQEPYSIAIVIREHFPELAHWDIRIVGTDLCAAVLERAAAGRYMQHEIQRGLPAALRARYFDVCGTEWRIKPSIRQMVSYRQLNLLDRWPFVAQDLIFLRNVLMYFDPAAKRTILARVCQTLQPDGFLILGSTESPALGSTDDLVALRCGTTALYQRLTT